MQKFFQFISTNSNYTRTNLPITTQIVVHAVAGSGKTTLIKDFKRENPDYCSLFSTIENSDNFEGIKFLNPTEVNSSESHLGKLLILDEYLQAPKELLGKFDVLLSDPYQSPHQALEPHFICNKSYRFGTQTCNLLRSLGYNIESTSTTPEKITIARAFETEVIEPVIALEQEVVNLLEYNQVKSVSPCEVVGQQFTEVTLILNNNNLRELNPVLLYLALSRHREHLLILTEDATISTS
uniref:TGB1 n=1 Tax=Dioscorea potexvirus 1 TaxID=2794413 RepID=A0A7T5UG47_9VIRU|nr:TGB1 [Dioscorea potexvirus 1]